MRRRSALVIPTVALVVACGSSSGGGDAASTDPSEVLANGAAPSSTPRSDAPPGPSGGASPERAVLAKLGLAPRLAFGLGNDSFGNDPSQMRAYGLGPKVDLHYMYLSNLDWPSWTVPEGDFVTAQADAAKAQGVVPMFTLYQGAAWGDGNVGAFADPTFMKAYWHGVRVLFDHLGSFGAPAVVHVEPDLWGYFQEQGGDDPSATPVKVGSLVAECSDLPEDVSGLGKCIVRLARERAPKVVIGLSASTFGAYTNDGQSDPTRIAAFLAKVGAADADITVVEMLDRDAGCYEKGVDPRCKRAGTFYWDETNAKHPSFHDHFAWTKAIRDGVGKPLLWWQVPLGVPSATPGGTTGHYRDNRVRYVFAHPGELVASGGIGVVFGAGAPNQTDTTTDGGQLAGALGSYLRAPAAVP